MNVEDIASKINAIFGIQRDQKDQISVLAVFVWHYENKYIYVSSGSAETLARGGGITNHHLIAYSLSNICKKITKIG